MLKRKSSGIFSGKKRVFVVCRGFSDASINYVVARKKPFPVSVDRTFSILCYELINDT